MPAQKQYEFQSNLSVDSLFKTLICKMDLLKWSKAPASLSSGNYNASQLVNLSVTFDQFWQWIDPFPLRLPLFPVSFFRPHIVRIYCTDERIPSGAMKHQFHLSVHTLKISLKRKMIVTNFNATLKPKSLSLSFPQWFIFGLNATHSERASNTGQGFVSPKFTSFTPFNEFTAIFNRCKQRLLVYLKRTHFEIL